MKERLKLNLFKILFGMVGGVAGLLPLSDIMQLDSLPERLITCTLGVLTGAFIGVFVDHWVNSIEAGK